MTENHIRVLLIEDDTKDGDRIKDLLRSAGNPVFEIRHVRQMGEAAQLLAANVFDIILSDLGLPDSEGLATLEYIRKKAPGAPVIVLTTLDQEPMAERALQNGAQEYLFKSELDPRTLSGAIQYVLHG